MNPGRSLPALLVALCLAAPAGALAADGPTADPCRPDDGAGWMGCADQIVEIRGKAPETLAQHPLLAPPPMPGGPAIRQDYLETPVGLQVIVLAADSEPVCAGPMRVRGTLRLVDRGGEKGSKDSYRGWALENATIACE